MRIAGFFLMLAGWPIAITAVLLLHTSGSRGMFAGAALAIQALGLALIARSYLPGNGERVD